MKVDRIVSDLLGYVNRCNWWRERQVKQRPYRILQTWRLAGRGLLHRVQRPRSLCPRHVDAYIFEPYRQEGGVRDIHITCDHLEGMKAPLRGRGKVRGTHRLTILVSDHWINDDGRYNAEQIYSLDDDWQGNQPERDAYAIAILYQVAMAFYQDATDWTWEVDTAKRLWMGEHYTPTLSPNRHSVDSVAWALRDRVRRAKLGARQ